MVVDILDAKFMMLFLDGLLEPLHGWVKRFEPTTPRVGINKTRDMQDATSKNRLTLNLISLIRVNRSSPFIRIRPGNQRWVRRPERS